MDEIERLLTQLHRLGFIAWYNDAKLSSHVILKPQSVIDAIATVITTRHRLSSSKVACTTALHSYMNTGILEVRGVCVCVVVR